MVVRSLFDMVDSSNQNWIEPVAIREEILRYHLIQVIICL